MEPLKIQIEVKLSDETLEVLRRIAAASIFASLNKEGLEEVMEAMREEAETEVPARDEEPEKAEEPAVGDMPDFGAEQREISDDELAAKTRETVSRLKAQHVNPTVVRTQVFVKYGISQSTECPKDKREAFLADLTELGKEE